MVRGALTTTYSFSSGTALLAPMVMGPLTTEKRTSPLMLAMPAVLTLALHRASTAWASGLVTRVAALICTAS